MFDFQQTLHEFESNTELRDTAITFLDGGLDVRRYVLGKNEQASWCAGRVPVDGVVDDSAVPGAMWNGYPLVHADLVPEGAIVVNCSTSIRPISAHERLARIEGLRALSYADLMRADHEVPLPDFVASFRADYSRNKDKWGILQRSLADDSSLSVLDRIMRYRLTADYRHMAGFSVRFNDQYFDPVVPLSDMEVFVDCGGFDGDTALEFCARNPEYKRIYVFEPSLPNFQRAAERLRGRKNVFLIPLGVSNAKGTLSFDSSSGSASSVTVTGGTTIDVVSIDEYVEEPVTYVKMDLEGWEMNALSGTRRHILEEHPKLAISVYHQSSDLWRIPEFVLGLRGDYNVYLRHYSEGWSETVMYFIPR